MRSGRQNGRRFRREKNNHAGVGFSVEQLEFNRVKPENAAKLENYPDDYYDGLHCACSNETRPEEIEHHAGEVAYTWYAWMTNELIFPVGACLP